MLLAAFLTVCFQMFTYLLTIKLDNKLESKFIHRFTHNMNNDFSDCVTMLLITIFSFASGFMCSSPGYGISLVAETTSGCFISADTAISYTQGEDEEDLEDMKKELRPPEEIGEQIASNLLGEIEQGGVVDSTHQGLLFLLCALCPQDVSKVRVGKLSPYGIEVLRHIRDFLGVKFVIKPDPSTGTVILKCVGCGLRNLSRKIS